MNAPEAVVEMTRTGEARKVSIDLDNPPRKGLLPHPALSVVLLVSWLFLANSIHPRLVLLGAVWAVVIPLVTRGFMPASPKVRWGALLRFLPVFLWDVMVANIAVAGLILSFGRATRPSWIVVPLDVTNPYAITTLANVISLTPGTVSAALGPDRRSLLVHVLDTADPVAEVAKIKSRYEAPMKEIFE